MSTEALWYSSYVDGQPPKMRRLCRLPIADQWRAAIDIAICFARGEAGYRKTSIGATGEVYWYWPAKGYALRSANAAESDWWLIPKRVELRAFKLIELATHSAMRANHSGQCSNEQTTAVLERWKRSGHWQRLIVGIAGDKHESGKRTKRDERRDERIADLHARALRLRYPVCVGEVAPYTVWTRRDAAEAIAEIVEEARYDWDDELTPRHIARIVAAGGLVEESTCTTSH